MKEEIIRALDRLSPEHLHLVAVVVFEFLKDNREEVQNNG